MKCSAGRDFSAWAFVMVAIIAAVVTFVTWLTLSLSDVGGPEQIGASALVFIAVGGTLLHYVVGCMRRHRAQGPAVPVGGRPQRAKVTRSRR